MKKHVIVGTLTGLIYLKWGFMNTFVILFVSIWFSLVYRIRCKRAVDKFGKEGCIRVKVLYIHKKYKYNIQLDLGIIFLNHNEMVYISAFDQKKKVAISKGEIIAGKISSLFLDRLKKITISTHSENVQFGVWDMPKELIDFIEVVKI